MGFKEGIFVLAFIAIAAPFAFKITSSIPGFKDEAILGIVFLFYAIDAFLSRSGDYFPAAAIQSVAGTRKAVIETTALQRRIAPKQSPQSASRYTGLHPAGSFRFRRR